MPASTAPLFAHAEYRSSLCLSLSSPASPKWVLHTSAAIHTHSDSTCSLLKYTRSLCTINNALCRNTRSFINLEIDLFLPPNHSGKLGVLSPFCIVPGTLPCWGNVCRSVTACMPPPRYLIVFMLCEEKLTEGAEGWSPPSLYLANFKHNRGPDEAHRHDALRQHHYPQWSFHSM